MLKNNISKDSIKTLFYRNCKKFEVNKFARDLTHELQNIKTPSYSQFEKSFVTVLDNHVPFKKKQLRFNHSSLMTKALRKAIMTRSRLKKRSYGNWNKYKKQRNLCMELLRKTKQDYFNNIGIKSISDTKKFWKTIKSYFSSKGITFNKIFLYEKGSLIKDPTVIATTMSDFFVNTTETIGLK